MQSDKCRSMRNCAAPACYLPFTGAATRASVFKVQCRAPCYRSRSDRTRCSPDCARDRGCVRHQPRRKLRVDVASRYRQQHTRTSCGGSHRVSDCAEAGIAVSGTTVRTTDAASSVGTRGARQPDRAHHAGVRPGLALEAPRWRAPDSTDRDLRLGLATSIDTHTGEMATICPRAGAHRRQRAGVDSSELLGRALPTKSATCSSA
jgi:hypothetical protein